MTDRVKRTAVANRQATDKLLDNKKRRSSAQVQQDKQTAAAAAAATEEEKTNLEAEKKQRVAAFEDRLRKEDQQREKNMARPDLVTALPHSLIIYLLGLDRGNQTLQTNGTSQSSQRRSPT